MSAIDLQSLDVEELEAVISEAQELLKKRRTERRDKAIADAKAILAKAGISPRELTDKPARVRKRSKPDTALVAGTKYVNPDKPDQVYTAGRGRKPQWLTDLRAQGRMPKAQA